MVLQAKTAVETASMRAGLGREGWPLPSALQQAGNALPYQLLLHDLVLSDITNTDGAVQQQQAAWKL
jgi:hypothetical protein